MKLTKIKVSKFKSIYDELEIDFNEVRGFWKIGGSVGAGKTTIGEAILFGLFGTIGGKNNGDLISWGEKRALVEVWCRSKGHDIYIKREINKHGQSPIYAEVDGEELIFTNKRDAQQQLETEYFDVSRTTLELLCIISFNNFKSLATLNASDTKKFLDQVLGFYTLTQYAEVCKELRKQNNNKGISIRNEMCSNQAQINKILDIANQAKIDGDIQETQQRITTVESEMENWETAENEKLAKLRKDWTGYQAELSKIKTLGSNKKKEIDFIKRGTCPTCGAPIDQSQLAIKEQEREVLLSQYKMVNEQAEQKQAEINTIELSMRSKRNEFKQQLVQLRSLLTQLKEQEKRSKINMSAVDELNAQNEELQLNLNRVQCEDAEWSELFTILNDDVRVEILSSFIPTLNKNILNYTQQLRQPYIIEFDSAFKCSIRICGMDDDIALSSLSTGQLKTVDMCIIMGVLSTIINNVSFNILFLDELISNAHKELRDDICRVLKLNMDADRTIFLISHADVETLYLDGEINASLRHVDEMRTKSVYTFETYENLRNLNITA